MTRRDRCYLLARRGMRLHIVSQAVAWESLCSQLEELGEKDVPKFHDVIHAIRRAIITARKPRLILPPPDPTPRRTLADRYFDRRT